MKIKKTEYGIELIPETPFEKECLVHLARQSSITVKFEDHWDLTGPVKIEGQPHPWDK